MADGEQHRLNARGAGSRFPEHLYDFVVESPVVWTEAIEYLLEANGRLAHLVPARSRQEDPRVVGDVGIDR